MSTSPVAGVKTHAQLLVRDALAAEFVSAAGGADEPCARLQALAHWAAGGPATEALAELRAEDDGPLFDAAGKLVARFAPFEAYARDRARRFAAALTWIQAEGCAGDPLETARAAWDAGLFFEVHELLEPVWLRTRGKQRDVLRGLIMAGAAMHHLVSGNRAGARGLLRDGARHLGSLPGATPLDLESFARSLLELASAIDSGEIRGPDDVVDPPRLERR